MKFFKEDGRYDVICSGSLMELNYKEITSNTLALQKQLCLDYEQDIVKYAVGIEKARIRNVYRNIPVFLAKENKKFQISKVAPDARSRNYRGSVDGSVLKSVSDTAVFSKGACSL